MVSFPPETIFYTLPHLLICDTQKTHLFALLSTKRLSHFRAVFEQILTCRSISQLDRIVLPLKIDYYIPSGVSSYSDASSARLVRKYLLTKRAKKFEVMLIILLTLLDFIK